MDFKDLDLTLLDRDLSEEQRKEWNMLYASFRSGSMLTGRVAGMDINIITVPNEETGEMERREINCLIIINYRVKILIPEQEIWFDEATQRPAHVLRSMTGATVDYVITHIDREGECCLASRRMAMHIRRHSFLRVPPKENDRVKTEILAVGRSHLLCNTGGFDMTLRQRELSYGMIQDLRERYRPGDVCYAIVKDFDNERQKLHISVKEAEPHPFDGADIRHPIRSRRASVISGKYKGGVFCKLEDNLDCLCTYSPVQCDEDFQIGDQVIVAITQFNYTKKQVYGKIVAKW